MEKRVSVKPTYGLFTAVAMIVGIVIGSGIYFKVDDILAYTGGNIWQGMLVIALGSISIVFGSLSISELALRSATSGGIFSYYEQYVHPSLAATLGLFTAYVYLPTVIAVVTWVAALFTLGETGTLETQVLLAVVYLLVLTFINIYSRVLAGYLQSLSTMVKVLPLILIAGLGVFWSGAQPDLPTGTVLVPTQDVGWGWLSGLVPLYFAYDGWSIVANIAPEIKSPRKNLPRALMLGPMIVLTLYLLFFYGLTQILGEEFILSMGDKAIHYAMVYLFGNTLGRGAMVIIIISVLGVSNGMLLATMRLPQAFAARGWIRSEAMAQISLKHQLSIPASLSVTVTTLIWLGVHYLVSKFQLLPGNDISEITIVFNNTSLIILYLAVLAMYKRKEIQNPLTGLVAPVLAIFGAVTLLIGSLMSNFWMVLGFFVFCTIFCLLAYLYIRKIGGQTT